MGRVSWHRQAVLLLVGSLWEAKLAESIPSVKRGGAVPVSAAPDGKRIPLVDDEHGEASPVIELHGVHLQDLKALLQGKCTRALDGLTYDNHGTTGMHREGLKWGVAEILARRLAIRHSLLRRCWDGCGREQ